MHRLADPGRGIAGTTAAIGLIVRIRREERRAVKKHRLDDMFRGWFVGNFSPTVLNTEACEVACKHYRAGEREDRHYHKLATEVTLVVAGRIAMNGIQWSAGDIVVVEPSEAVEFEALEDAVTVVVKVPGATNDKYAGSPI